MVVREAPARIGELIGWGADFDRQGTDASSAAVGSTLDVGRSTLDVQGSPHHAHPNVERPTSNVQRPTEAHAPLALGREGGHSHRRIVHALGDATGREMMRAIIARARQLPNLAALGTTPSLIDLLTHEGVCRGALVWNPGTARRSSGPSRRSWPPAGPGRSIARRPTRPWPPATAWRWPTAPGPSCATWSSCSSIPRCSTSPAAAARLITEAVRGEGAYLRRSPRPPLHARVRPAGRAGPARRGQPGHRQPDGEDAARRASTSTDAISTRTSSAGGSPASPPSARSSTSTSPATASRFGPAPLHDRRRHRRSRRAAPRCRACGRPAR